MIGLKFQTREARPTQVLLSVISLFVLKPSKKHCLLFHRICSWLQRESRTKFVVPCRLYVLFCTLKSIWFLSLKSIMPIGCVSDQNSAELRSSENHLISTFPVGIFRQQCSERNSDRQLQILGKVDTCHLNTYLDSRRILIWSFDVADVFAFLSVHDTYLKSWILKGFCQILASLEEFSKQGICDSSRILTDKSSGIIINTVTVGFCWKFEITGSLCSTP